MPFVNGPGPILFLVAWSRPASGTSRRAAAGSRRRYGKRSLSILRTIVLGGTIGLSTVVICLVAADRVAHTSFPAPPTMTVAQVPLPEPETTGTVMQGAETPEPKAPPMPGGFDTERLNALMRGEMPPPPVRVQAAARKR